MHIAYFASRVQGWGGGKVGEAKREERRGRRKKKGRGKKMEGGRERRKKVVGAAKVREHGLVHAYALDCTEGKNLHERNGFVP